MPPWPVAPTHPPHATYLLALHSSPPRLAEHMHHATLLTTHCTAPFCGCSSMLPAPTSTHTSTMQLGCGTQSNEGHTALQMWATKVCGQQSGRKVPIDGHQAKAQALGKGVRKMEEEGEGKQK
ncbi:hypothetical protein B0H10DRAFT_1950419 [Mycena sp. CBHHK59/15]|nr:hypothetical protein B0H10DRAFT_1950419 [Mycena sp. CBHHK59/15]